MKKLILIIFALLLWITSYHISDAVYPGDSKKAVDNYHELNKVFELIILLLILTATQIKEYKLKITEIIISVFMSFIVEDIIDRLIFDVRHFEFNDLIGAELIISYHILKYVFNIKIFNIKSFDYDWCKTLQSRITRGHNK